MPNGVPEASCIAEAGLMLFNNARDLVFHPDSIKINDVYLQAARCMNPFVAHSPVVEVETGLRGSPGAVHDRLSDLERNLASRENIEIDIRRTI